MAREEHAAALKLPTFLTAQPDVWFAQAEAQFNRHGITADDTKYYYIVLDLISQPPDYKYSTLKGRLIDTFGVNKHERASRLLHFRLLETWSLLL